METNGIKSIDTATLRRLMPMWAKAAGFGVDDRDAKAGLFSIAVDGSHGLRVIGGWFGKVMRQIRITDGELMYRVDDRDGLVYVKMKRNGDVDA